MKFFLIGILFSSSLVFSKSITTNSFQNSSFSQFQDYIDSRVQVELESAVDRNKKGNVKGNEHELEIEFSLKTFKNNRIIFINNASLVNEYSGPSEYQNESVEIGNRHRFKLNKRNRLEVQLMGVHFTSDEFREDKNTNIGTYLEIDYRWRPFSFYTLVIRPRGYKFFERDPEIGKSRSAEYRIDLSQRFRYNKYVMLNLNVRGKTTIERDKNFNREIDEKVDLIPAIRLNVSKNFRFEFFTKTKMMEAYDGKIISDEFFLYPVYGSELTVRF